MGKIGSKLKRKDLKDLQAATDLSTEELKAFYKAFVKDYPDGTVTVEQFKKIFQQYFPKGDAEQFAEQVFRSFDTNNDGTIDFREFICGLSITRANSLEGKLKWAFSMYDLDKDGEISRSEMLEVVTAIYKMVENTVEVPEDESTPEKRVDKIFSSLDLDMNGTITLEEFIEGAKLDPSIARLLQSD